MRSIRLLFQSMRPDSWYKNLVLFLGIIFGSRFLDPAAWEKVFAGFFLFCALAGGLYILNDISDTQADRKHPIKCNRPIASGKLNPNIALAISLLLITTSLGLSYAMSWIFFLLALAYLILDLVYFTILKRLFIVDVLAIATGCVIRAVAGAALADVTTSSWLIIGTFLLALYLALAKRHTELETMPTNASEHRQTLAQYSVATINRMTNIVASTLLIAYLLYTTSMGKPYMMFTIPFGLYCMFRYFFLVEHKNVGDNAQLILADKPMVISGIAWLAAIIIVLIIWP